MHVLHVVGARPNFMKLAPVLRALGDRARQTLVHTGQHYDREMSEAFFGELGLPEPDVNLAVGSDPASVQTGRMLIHLDPLFDRYRPDVCVVYGDVNSTLAGALAAARRQVPVAHVEAGLRSYDRTMPEELNRELTDRVADWLFTPSLDADENLVREGIPTDMERVDVNGLPFPKLLIGGALREGRKFLRYYYDDPEVEGDEDTGSPKFGYAVSFHARGSEQKVVVGSGIYLRTQ